ncbi:DUF3040 domain-containing protein [Actinocatenispora rupis]|uniref:DUF3040 domain-containing protein n=1 Tax=Actinocatenispora rupis TaxID=519421 RepID=UPI0019406361|nr:DUF3040 domain-containing protein [Actinocatenispora rupis]
MLSEREQRVLDEIDLAATAADHRFADGLRRGRPRLPQEFRHWRLRVLAGLLFLLVLPVCALLVVRGRPYGLLLAAPAFVGAVWGLGADRPGHHR